MPQNMLEAFEAVEHLGEISRLFFVLSRGQPRMEQKALVEGCKRTAGLSSRYPRPKPAIALAISAGLLTSSNGVVTATDRGRNFASQISTNCVDLSHPQAKLLLGAFLDQSLVERSIALLLSNFQMIHGQLMTRKNSISSNTTQLLFCRLLQQLGAIKTSGDYYLISEAFEDMLTHLVIQSARLTQAELLKRLDRQRERGELAEQKALEIERDRLIKLKRPDLASRVERVSIHDVSAGYDIRSFEKNAKPRFIEVKSSVGSHVVFEWSANEREKAVKEEDAFYIYFVPFSYSLPELSGSVIVIKNPILNIMLGTLQEIPTGHLVRKADTFGETGASRGRRDLFAILP